MPTVISESDSFDATVQRPNNGELADAASILLTAQKLTNRGRYLYNRGRSAQYDVTRAPYSADRAGVADSMGAFQGAIDACHAAGGGIVWVPPGTYLLNGGLTLYQDTMLVGVESRSILRLNHSTADFISLASETYVGELQIQGIQLEGAVANTGKILTALGTTARARLTRCSINRAASNLQGTVADGNNATSYAFIDCQIIALCNTSAFLSAFEMYFHGGKVTMAPGSAAEMVTFANKLVIDGTEFDHSGATVSGGAFIDATGGHTQCSGALFTGNGFTTYAFKIGSSGTLDSDGNNRFLLVTPYNRTGRTASPSRLQLLGTQRQTPVTTTLTCPDGVAGSLIECSAASEPQIALPNILAFDQKHDVIVRNTHGSSTWAGPITFVGQGADNAFYSSTDLTGLPDQGAVSLRFSAVNYAGSAAWVQVGAAMRLS